MNLARVLATGAATLGIALLGSSPAQAVPKLQLYIEGATYDLATETWVTTDGTFDIWVIGNVDGPGGAKGDPILDVKLAAAVVTGDPGSITLTPGTTSLVTDPSTPGAPAANGVSADGAVPLLGDGKPLATHGIYEPGVSFYEWELGDFSLTDSPVGDFIGGFPATLYPNAGQINVYRVTIAGFADGVHFDVYNHVEGANHSTFGPFSHDAGAVVPEPRATLLFGVGCLLAGVAGRSTRSRAA
jgi:hypothetical protein